MSCYVHRTVVQVAYMNPHLTAIRPPTAPPTRPRPTHTHHHNTILQDNSRTWNKQPKCVHRLKTLFKYENVSVLYVAFAGMSICNSMTVVHYGGHILVTKPICELTTSVQNTAVSIEREYNRWITKDNVHLC